MEVMDVNAIGLHFTWNQKPKGSNGVLKKIDWIMCNIPFNDSFPGSFAIFQPYCISDHSPCVLRIPKVCKPKSKPFKFYNFLVYKEGFHSVVDIGWKMNVNRYAMYRVFKRLKGLKSPLRKLLNDQGNLHDRVNRLRVELDKAKKAIDRNPSSSNLREEHAHYLSAFKEASLDEERFLRQKAKVERLNAGDSNTAYFHYMVKSKCMRNRIEMVRDSDNNLYEGNDVAVAFVSHYEQFLSIEGNTVLLANQDLFHQVLDYRKVEFMVREVLDMEIKSALFSIWDDKAPGPNGFTTSFFKKAWDTVGRKVTCVIKEFFANCKILKELNHTIVSLTPKVSTPAKINDYYLISCCNVLYKCISKIIANHIKVNLGDLVSINQSAFVLGRRIFDNILLTQELMRTYHRRRGPPRCAFKVDIQKAYDTVDWGFLKSILIGFGFHLIMEAEDFQFHHHCEKQRIINLCFVDDLFLFSRGHPNSVQVIMSALEEFKNVSGLVPSTLPVRYLGVPLISSMLLYRDCKILVEKLESHASIFILPIRIASDLKQSMRGFLWCQGDRIEDFNVSLMATHIWSILTSRESLWVKWIHSYKLCGRSFWGVPCPGDVTWFDRWADIVRSGFSILSSVPLIQSDREDVIMWRDRDGVFRPFSVACACESIRLRADVVPWYSIIWFPHCIPRHATHLWLVVKKKLKTRDRLQQWDVGPDTNLNLLRCPLCNVVPDSHSHLFFECSYSSQVWSQIRVLIDMNNIAPRIEDVLAFIISVSKSKSVVSIISRIVLAATTYYLWNERNSRLFKKKIASVDQVVQVICQIVRLKMVSFKFKKVSAKSHLMLDRWKVLSVCVTHDGNDG
ncbi:hypothetical protein Tco_0945508 [Tanacetum coccineum]